MTHSKKLKNLAFQSLAENNIDILEGYMSKEQAEKRKKRKQANASRKKNRKR